MIRSSSRKVRHNIPPHLTHPNLYNKPYISVGLIGCGGTGSQILTGLGQMHASLQAMNEQHGFQCKGLQVTVYDPDTVSQFNIGRQLFYANDVGLNKASCLVNRVNMAYSTKWDAVPSSFLDVGTFSNRDFDVVISCTDTAKSRRDLHNHFWEKRRYDVPNYWLDCANLATVGQVVLGQIGTEKEDTWLESKRLDPDKIRWKGQLRTQIPGKNGTYDHFAFKEDKQIRLPCVTELFPDLMSPDFDETEEPSCSMVDALKKQSLFVNRMVSAYALDLLWQLIREGSVDNQGCYFNLRTRTTQPIPLKLWPIQEAKPKEVAPVGNNNATQTEYDTCESKTYTSSNNNT